MTHQEKTHEKMTLKAEALCCRRGGRHVFENLEFSVTSGQLLLLAGPNGSGKSTLLRLLAGLLPSETGSLMLNDTPLRQGGIADTRLFLYSGHQSGLKKALSLRENSTLYYQLMEGGSLSDEALYAAADGFDLGGLIDKPLRYFSSGQTHRAALMRFRLIQRPIWLMDEPTVGLDTESRKALTALMQQHLKAGGIIIAASHDPLGLSGQEINMATFASTGKALEYWI